MARTPLLLALLSLCTGSLLQPMLTQPPSLSVAPVATARLTCTLRSDINVGSYGIFWLQQQPGRPPRYLLYYKSDSDKGQGAGVPSRFSGAKDTSANAGVLVISGPQPEDEADYYCELSHGGASHSDTPRGKVEQKPQPAPGHDLGFPWSHITSTPPLSLGAPPRPSVCPPGFPNSRDTRKQQCPTHGNNSAVMLQKLCLVINVLKF
ncbi:PREDICTED: immunoglobulin iota chain-like [Condylura cristata]|uniref:immunoglobulin iota chain-like n=1 Tax=Condylura cristata TaxID=143302 RepID=UPI00033437CF|nr:PREDICTED: immunoglobulin iota chain-like [Condylura cristata]